MARVIAAVAAVVAAASLAVTLTRSSSPGETSCTRLVYQYLATAARSNAVTIKKFRVLACRKAGNVAVARVRIVVSQLVLDPFTGQILGRQTTAYVFVFHLTKSPWQINDVKQAA